MTGLGRILQEARAARGIGLEEAENATRISRRYLDALEQEDFALFPAPVYARGFLRSYSQFLGLNPADTLALFPMPAAPEPAQRTVASGPTTSSRTQGTRLPQPHRIPAVLTAAVVVFLVVLGVVYIVSSIGGDDSTVLQVSPTPRVTRTTTRTPASATPSVTPTGPAGTPADTVPDFRELSRTDAQARAQESGLDYVIIQVTNDAVEPDTVFDQTPANGTQVDGNLAVLLYVSLPAPEQ